MAVVISHSSALAILRAVPPQTGLLQLVDQPIPLSDISTSPASLAEVDLDCFGVAKPVHVLTTTKATRPRGASVHAHRVSFAEFPAGSLLQLSPDVYVCGPELVFMQMTSQLGFVARVVLGHELCGAYSQFARMVSGFYDRPPLTSAERIERMSYLFPNMRGTDRARAALRYVRDGSRSPMETVVSCMLFLPAGEGGYGFVRPSLNYEVPLDDAARGIARKKACYIDTAFPSVKVGLEYYGADYHTDPAKDRARIEALMHMGWTMHTLLLDDVRSFAALDRMVGLFAERVPRAVPSAKASAAAQKKLLKSLFTFTRFGLGLDSVLFGVPVSHGKVKVHL